MINTSAISRDLNRWFANVRKQPDDSTLIRENILLLMALSAKSSITA